MFEEATSSSLDKLEMIDSMQRLGFAYHFEDEINEALKTIYNNRIQLRSGTHKTLEDLYAVALEFRLLRKHGYDINQGNTKLSLLLLLLLLQKERFLYLE